MYNWANRTDNIRFIDIKIEIIFFQNLKILFILTNYRYYESAEKITFNNQLILKLNYRIFIPFKS